MFFPFTWGSLKFSWNYGDSLQNDLGMGQNETTRGPQALVHVSIYQGKPFWVTLFLTHSRLSNHRIKGDYLNRPRGAAEVLAVSGIEGLLLERVGQANRSMSAK